jgi:hypothetical protein
VVPRYLRGYGLIEAPLADCLARLDGARLGDSSILHPHPSGQLQVSRRDAAVSYLNHLTHPATRWVLFALTDRWTAVVNNLRDGSDFADGMVLAACSCQARVCRVVDYDPGPPRARRESDGYPARIFELVDAEGTSVRTIAAADDGGRWVFETSGNPLPVEASFNYAARRKRDRFTTDNLHTLLSGLGIDRPVPTVFAATDEFFLIDERLQHAEWAAQVEARACTPAQADDPGFIYLERGLGWTAHMRTHAASVVFDLTRAVLVSPHLRDQVRPHLDAARRQLGRSEFRRLTREAEALLRRR